MAENKYRERSVKKEGYTEHWREMPDPDTGKMTWFKNHEQHNNLGDKDKEELGSFKGSVYYSKRRPEGDGAIKYNREEYLDIMDATLDKRSREKIGRAQHILANIGYIEPSQIDSTSGPITDGAIQRYLYNSNSVENVYDSFKVWMDNLFDSKEE